MSILEKTIRDLVIANRVLANESIADAFGHVSVRHPTNPERFLQSCSRSPELVEARDIMQFALDGTPCDSDKRQPYLERFIHGAIYEARPDVNAIAHCHADDVLPFTVAKYEMKIVLNGANVLGARIPLWDQRATFGDTNLLVMNIAQGRDLATCLGKNNVVLMRGHGFTAAADSLCVVLRMAILLPRNARMQLAAMQLGELIPMSPGEIATGAEVRGDSSDMQRAWEYWARRAGCEDLLAA
jgi:ribulose-5-phosphate 4-epimerase/fuculose-1-phosphate aldolase